MSLQQTIENIWENRDLLQNEDSKSAIREVISKLDLGELRVAEPSAVSYTHLRAHET